ncbi:PEP-CTERM sorting domain-containing protein [Geminisphaera colitermitum]|uniref:PEP-CTERM sorting domain-containing protein n=1 Tax=Geminisphaera colitermitum TaxID=1148786 RepID=UPI000158D0A6|nr:PEP-CTERM sorting domain-containing protein [Geminisphaera colitermitum]
MHNILKTMLLSAILGITVNVNATSLGLATSSAGYAHWDTFSSVSFTNDTPDNFNDIDFTATLSSSLAAGMVLGSGDRLYAGSGPTPNAFDFTINVTAAQVIETFSLQIKFTTPLQSGTDEAKQDAAESFFTINTPIGWGEGSQVLIDKGIESNSFFIYAWTWTGLNISAFDTFAIGITSPPGHVSVDGIRIDAAAVPEPATYAAIIGGLALAGVMILRRHRR